MGIGRAGFYTHDWVDRVMFRARYVEGRHSATCIHPELPPLKVGGTVRFSVTDGRGRSTPRLLPVFFGLDRFGPWKTVRVGDRPADSLVGSVV